MNFHVIIQKKINSYLWQLILQNECVWYFFFKKGKFYIKTDEYFLMTFLVYDWIQIFRISKFFVQSKAHKIGLVIFGYFLQIRINYMNAVLARMVSGSFQKYLPSYLNVCLMFTHSVDNDTICIFVWFLFAYIIITS